MGLTPAVVGDRWRPGIGDPTVLGWATVVAYALSFVLCVVACQRARRTPTGRGTVLWAGLALTMLGLGINKQLDLQSWFTQVARDLLVGQGLYEHRHAYQQAFIAVVGCTGLMGVGILSFVAVRRRWPILPVAGATLLVTYVVIRSASFHHVDRIINMSVPGARLSSVLELVGIAMIGGSAARPPRTRSEPVKLTPLSLIEAVGKYR